VPFVRRTRDRKGYECTSVLHVYRPSNGPQRTRVLYLFRSPSNLTVGRHGLDDEVMEALEHTHPDLSFDWTVLLKEAADLRADRWERPTRPAGRRPDRPERSERPGRPASAGRGSQSSGREEAPTGGEAAAMPRDASLLGQVAGPEAAARLRARYQGLVHRISRRVTAPEVRDRLLAAAGRLNPDDWSDEAAIRAGLATFDREWQILTADVPGRRRGRRGGRTRDAGPAAAGPSGIMSEDGEANADHARSDASDPGRDPDAPRDDGGVGPVDDGPPTASDV
jgi:hypothetical protein